jgi:hypothetical protein
MALTERTRLYEVLIRFAPDGTPSALQRNLEEVLRDGEVIHATEQMAQPLDPDTVQGLIASSDALMLAENMRLRAVLTAAQRETLGLEA